MNVNASNALLKVLEEPPPGSHIVLVSAAPQALLPTILSRCQRTDVRTVDAQSIEQWLRSEVTEGLPARDDIATLLIEHGNAPFNVLDAIRSEKPPLWRLLSAARDPRAHVTDVAEELKNETLHEVLGKWGRYVHRLVRDGKADTPVALFYDDLVDTRRMALVNTGLNSQMQLERLLLVWRELEIQA